MKARGARRRLKERGIIPKEENVAWAIFSIRVNNWNH
jgi:hypothetical protein